jgi:hypothetical protein
MTDGTATNVAIQLLAAVSLESAGHHLYAYSTRASRHMALSGFNHSQLEVEMHLPVSPTCFDGSQRLELSRGLFSMA